MQILLNESAANMGSAAMSWGVSNPNLISCEGIDNPPNDKNGRVEIYVPEAPGIYAPQYRTGWCAGGPRLPRSGATMGCALVRNDLMPGYVPGTTYYNSFYQTVPGIMTTDRWQGLDSNWDIQDAPSWVGAGYIATAFDKETGLNYTVQDSARPRFWGWSAGGLGVGVFQNVVIEDNPTLDALLAAGNNYTVSYEGGWILSIYTANAGPTGNRCEILVCDPAFTKYWILKPIPRDGFTDLALKNTGAPFTTSPWQVKVDKYGIVWLFAIGTALPYSASIITSFEPIAWELPQIAYVPRASVSLPCFETCLPVVTY